MKKFICIILAIIMLVPFGTMLGAVAEDTFKAEDSSNTAFAENSVESTDSGSITGKVNVTFSFNGDGTATLTQNATVVATVNIAANGTYAFANLAAGQYDLLISIPGWTEYNVYDISVAEDETVEIYESTVIAGDVNHSGLVDINDVQTMLQNFGKAIDDGNVGCDINHDSCIDIADLSNIITSQNYGEKAYSSYYVNNGYTETY